MTQTEEINLQRRAGSVYVRPMFEAWDEGYDRGMRDEIDDLEPADNPYRAALTGPAEREGSDR